MAEKDRQDDATVAAFSGPPRRKTPPAPSSRPAGAPDRNAPGAKFFGAGQRYQVLGQIGKGGFGTVYRAYDHRLEKFVAIKTLNTEDISPLERPEFIRRFDAEAKAAAALEHPGAITVLDYDPYADEPYLVMPLIEFGTLRDRLAEHPRMPWPMVVDLGIQVAEALHHAHTHGIQAHRDIKPGNIFCATNGRYKVGDFGIARKRRLGEATRSTFLSAGTPRYMAPEQITSPSRVDARTDLFSLCVVLYEALTGKVPFRGVTLDFDPEEDPTQAHKIVEIAFRDPVPIRKLVPEVPAELAAAIEHGLARDPRERFRDCATFAVALRQIRVPGSAGERKSRLPALLRIAAVTVVAAAVYFFWPQINALVRGGDPLQLARQAAVEAKAPDFARELWEHAGKQQEKATALDSKTYREEAERLYWQAAVRAWAARTGEAKQLAERTLAEQYSGPLFRAAESEWKAAEALARRAEQQLKIGSGEALSAARETLERMRAAFASYQQAAGEASRQARPALAAGVDDLKRQLAARNELADGEQQADVKELGRALAAAEEALARDDLGVAQEQVEEAKRIAASVQSDAIKTARARAQDAYREALEHRVYRTSVPNDRVREWEEAEATYKEASSKLEAAQRDPDVRLARAAAQLFADAKAKYIALTEKMKSPARDGAAARTILAEAESARRQAEEAGAEDVPRAREKYEQAARALADARARVVADPARAEEDARRAGKLFAEAQALAAQVGKKIASDVAHKRSAALRAREQAERAGAVEEPEAAAAYRAGRASIDRAEAMAGDDVSVLALKLAAYEQALQSFSDAQRLARERPASQPAAAPPERRAPVAARVDAPFDIRVDPPVSEVITLESGISKQFWVRSNDKNLSIRWQIDGAAVHEAEGDPGLEFATFRAGLHRVQVTVSDAAGRRLTREWTVRVLPE